MRTLFAIFTLFISQAIAAPTPDDYIIGAEDVLSISVWREPELQKDDILVRPDGNISFPLAGDIKAAGKTTTDVKDIIVSRIKRYIPDPVVTVSVTSVGGNKVYVMGQVRTPGSYVIGRYVDVIQALTLAGGFTEYADRDNIRIIRHTDNKDTVFLFDYKDVMKGRRLEQNITLQGGDTIIVP